MRRVFALLGLFSLLGLLFSTPFFIDAQTTSPVGVSVTIQAGTPPVDSGGGGGGGGGGATGTPPSSSAAAFVMRGKAYPSAGVTLLRGGAVAGTATADAESQFTFTLTGLAAGIQTFSVYAEDSDRRKSVTLSLTLNLPTNTTTTVEGIIIPATIALSSSTVALGQTVVIDGQSVPTSGVNLFIHSTEIVRQTTTATNGRWRYTLNTEGLEMGDHTVRAKTLTASGEQSEFTETKSFRVIPRGAHGTPGSCVADVSDDNRADIIDLSILLYNWGIPKNPRADLNGDGRTDIVDFSILLYYWGTCI